MSHFREAVLSLRRSCARFRPNWSRPERTREPPAERPPEPTALVLFLKPCARAQEQKAAVLNAARDRAQRHIVDDEDERSRPAPFAKLCGSFAGMPG